MKILAWFKNLFYIVEFYNREIAQLQLRATVLEKTTEVQKARIEVLEAMVRENTDIAVDCGWRGMNVITVIGRYRNKDYIQTFHVHEQSIGDLIEQLKRMEQYATIRRVDAPPVIRALVDRELNPRW